MGTLRAAFCRHGAEQMRADARRALELAPERSFWQPSASLLLGVSFLLCRDEGPADRVIADTVELAQELGANDICSIALAERSLIAAARSDARGAEDLAQAALRVVVEYGLAEYATSALMYAALGRVALDQRDLLRAREHFDQADHLRPSLTWFMPYLGRRCGSSWCASA